MDKPNPVPSGNASPDAAAAKPVHKRSLFERLVVWVGILLLLGLVFFEWNSRNQFDTSLKNLEAAIGERDADGMFKGLNVNDLDKHVKGYAVHTDEMVDIKSTPVRGEPVIRKQHIISYQWPSMFKTYKIAVTVDTKDKVISAEAVMPNDEPPAAKK